MDTATAEYFTQELINGGELAGYRLISRLGYGKSAVIFAAERDDEKFALKVFHPGLLEYYGREAQLERIEREKKLIGWSHPNVARIVDGGETADGKYLFVAMERVPGVPLSSILNQIPRAAIPALVRQLALAAKALEDFGFVHRDIKPGNIHFIGGEEPRLVLLDLGVLKPIGDNAATNLQTPGVFIGTHQYSPPEMIHGQQADTIDGWRAVSYYQIGAVMHDLICGHPIFNNATKRIADLVRAVDAEEIVVKSTDVDDRLCDLANRCLLKNPKDRLRFVDWKHFLPVEGNRSADGRIDALRRRADLAKRSTNQGVLHAVELARTENVRLHQLCASFREQIDAAIGRLSGVLPLRSTEVYPARHPKPCILCTFVADPARGFSTPFRMQFALNEVDGSVAIETYARGSRGLNDTEIGWTHIGGFPHLTGFAECLVDWLIDVTEELSQD